MEIPADRDSGGDGFKNRKSIERVDLNSSSLCSVINLIFIPSLRQLVQVYFKRTCSTKLLFKLQFTFILAFFLEMV